ncbi:MAG: thioesterase family protein [Pseudomonadota bacterium]
MNLFFRRLWVFFLASLSSKTAPLDRSYVLNYRVWFTDQDMFMHMTNSRYLSFSDLARLNLLIRTGIMKALRKNRWHLEICGQTRTITRMLKAPQAFRMTCEIEGWSDAHIAFNHAFKRRGNTHAIVNTLMRVADADGNEVPPQILMDAVLWTQPSPELSDPFSGLANEITKITTA